MKTIAYHTESILDFIQRLDTLKKIIYSAGQNENPYAIKLLTMHASKGLEFDRVFIKVSKDKTSIIAGDYNLVRPRSHFMNYFKKVQGLSGSNSFNISQNKTISSNANFAVSRGKFARQILDTKEGNQGIRGVVVIVGL